MMRAWPRPFSWLWGGIASRCGWWWWPRRPPICFSIPLRPIMRHQDDGIVPTRQTFFAIWKKIKNEKTKKKKKNNEKLKKWKYKKTTKHLVCRGTTTRKKTKSCLRELKWLNLRRIKRLEWTCSGWQSSLKTPPVRTPLGLGSRGADSHIFSDFLNKEKQHIVDKSSHNTNKIWKKVLPPHSWKRQGIPYLVVYSDRRWHQLRCIRSAVFILNFFNFCCSCWIKI